MRFLSVVVILLLVSGTLANCGPNKLCPNGECCVLKNTGQTKCQKLIPDGTKCKASIQSTTLKVYIGQCPCKSGASACINGVCKS